MFVYIAFSLLACETSACDTLSLSVRDYFLLRDNISCALRKQHEKTLQMMADHGNICEGQEATYCMNGGTCYKIRAMNTLSCVCDANYKGSRCEQLQLFSISTTAGEAGLIAGTVILALLILVVLAVVIYYVRKVLKAKQQSQQNHQQQYWRVKPRTNRRRATADLNFTEVEAGQALIAD